MLGVPTPNGIPNESRLEKKGRNKGFGTLFVPREEVVLDAAGT